MKRVIGCLVCLCVALLSNTEVRSQSKSKNKSEEKKPSIKTADGYYDNYEFYLAAKEYGRVLEREPDNKYALFKLAESNRMFFNYTEAETYYKQLIDNGGEAKYPISKLLYGLMQKLNGKYEEAQETLQVYLDANSSNNDPELIEHHELAKIELEGCKLALLEMKEPQKNFNFENLKVPVNSNYSEYAPVVYENDSSIVIASARKESVGEEEYGSLGGEFSDNFHFVKTQGVWHQTNEKDLFSGLHTELNESPGSFTKDKKKFYFTRCDQLVKIEGVDVHECAIFVSQHVEGKWTKGEKLNENINQKDQWSAQPSLTLGGDTMFFVSKRPGGLGMHDIYMSISSGGENWGPAINLGPKINTPFVDMSPCYYPKEHTLFFSSNGRPGFGGLDIYIGKGNGYTEITNAGLPFNSNRDDFYFTLGEKKGFLASNRDGGSGNDDIYWFDTESHQSLVATVNKDSLDNAESISLQGVLKSKDNKPVEDVSILLKDHKDEILKKTSTDETGLFRFENIDANSYKVEIDEKDHRLTKNEHLVIDKMQVKKSNQATSRKLFENIYFDFDKYDLRPEALKTLDDLVEYCKANPEIQIEMNANTDAFGSAEYNQVLSTNRGKTALDYLISKGVKKSTIVINAKGEGTPIATNNNQAGRQLNRRVEFYIVGGKGYEAKAMAYVIEPKTTLYSVAKRFHMTVDELKRINGISGEKIEAYRPLRVKRTEEDGVISHDAQSFANSTPATDFPDQNIQQTNSSRKTNPVHVVQSNNEPVVKNTHQHNSTSAKLKEGESFYYVEAGTTLFSIAQKFGMKVDELKDLNGLSSNTLSVGQKLIVKKLSKELVDPSKTYKVKDGDTMFSIAKKFGLTVQELQEMNNLKDNSIYENMLLRIRK